MEQFKTRFTEFSQAVSRLDDILKQPENEYMLDGAIQRFEFTYELAWKTLKAYLDAKGIDVRNPKDTLKAAYQQGLLSDADGWSQLHQKRNLTTHTYDEALAKTVYLFLKSDGLKLFKALKIKLEGLQNEL